MKAPTACLYCRTKKRRCIIAAKGASCSVCSSIGLVCSSAFNRVPCSKTIAPAPVPLVALSHIETPSPHITASSPVHSVVPELPVELDPSCDNELRNELIHLYFDLLHDKQHAIFHRPTFIKEVKQGAAPRFLVLAIMAIVARFSTNPIFDNVHPWQRGRAWAEESINLFNARHEKVSVASLQECALLGNLAFIENDPGMESLYGAQAIRMVQLLGLPKKLSTNRVKRENEIRIWWTVWMMDTWTSASVSIPRQLIAEPEFPRPMEEGLYESLDPEAIVTSLIEPNEDKQHMREIGLWTQMIPLTTIMGEVHVLNKKAVNGYPSLGELLSDVERIAFKLDYWRSSLPQHLRNTPENLQKHADQGHGRIFAGLHFGYHHHSQLLYYQFLHHAVDSRPSRHGSIWTESARRDYAQKYAARCKYHAAELSDFMWRTNTTAGLECLWAINGHLLVVASSVHLHTLLFGEDETAIAEAKVTMERNFRMVLQMQTYWPGLHNSLSRLKHFHQACQESMHESFDMDRWMLRFLQEYALPVEDTLREPSNGDTRGVRTNNRIAMPHQHLLNSVSADYATEMLQGFLV